jgi:erythromycin esterase
LVSDILRAQPLLIGLGEATHGSAEFVTMRSKLTFELARRAQLQLVLLENDAIAAASLERYVNGEDVDLAQAVAALGFWTTDTYEFLQFMRDIRAYNEANPRTKIHVWGIDAQNTERPVTLLVDNAANLGLSNGEQALLKTVALARGKAVKQFTAEQRSALDALLSRLSKPAGSSDLDTYLALAARSLVIQVGYMDGDTAAMYDARRDAGMAQLARFIVDRLGVRRACLWAHDDHVARLSEGSESVGLRLAAAFANNYYPVGFYLYEGTSRAWDAAGKIGVISHSLGPPPAFTVESVLLSVASASDAAWIPLRRLSQKLRAWLEVPRYVRGLGAVYGGPGRTMLLLNIASAFDAIVVIRAVHDSSPTPTGVRRAKQ